MQGHRFQASAPLATHWRPATCQEVDCEAHLLGFKLVLDEEAHADQIDALRTLRHGRHFTEHHEVEGFIEFRFPAGQRCFKHHTTGIGRDPIMLHGVNAQVRQHVRAKDWHEDFNETSYQIQEQRKRG